MADYVLNRASVSARFDSLQAAQVEFLELAKALAALDDEAEALPAFRSYNDPWLILLVDQPHAALSMGDVAHSLYAIGEHEAAEYFDALQRMAPADSDLEEAEIEAVLRLEPQHAAQDHEACFGRAVEAAPDAMLCAVTGDLLVGLSRQGHWNVDHLAFKSGDKDYHLDHLSNSAHAIAIRDRRTQDMMRALTARDLWESRGRLFPNLKFGIEVEGQLARFDGGLIPLLFRRFADLDRRAAIWKDTSLFPDHRPRIKPESDPTMAQYALQRRFRNAQGQSTTYEEHIYVDSLYRIHLLKLAADQTIEIGYVGRHLPTVKHRT
ncbi:hypothetical protein [Mesorhizobium sp. WSM3626]|uniref:hypothetical protein n=1 Tax=Mesorhizobium sp. WSM3626 TaxID=1040987 RepID=UPI000519CF1A|nr:hypothetical protein [Mesorhizobium sp. WSM3626]